MPLLEVFPSISISQRHQHHVHPVDAQKQNQNELQQKLVGWGFFSVVITVENFLIL